MAFPTVVIPRAGDRFAGYLLLEEIARGGMGVIFRARQETAERDVALKMIQASRLRSHGILDRFRTEAESIAKLDHPNILPLYESGEEHGFPFYSMKLAERGSLAGALPRYVGKFQECAALLALVARAMHHAHERGILHRDLKPANILLGAGDTPYVGDFGLAKVLAPDVVDLSLTQTSAVLGTPHYAPPEQAGGTNRTLTPAADVYSLGAILYELASGQPPWAGSTMFTVLKRSSESSAPRLRDVCPNAPRAYETICDRCLQPEIALRYPTAAALADDLENFAAGRTLARFRPPFRARLRQWSRRRKWVLLGLGGLLVAAGGLGLGIQLRRANPDVDLSGSSSPEAVYFLKRSLDINPSTNITERGHLETTQEILERALKADPGYAAAHAELSRVHSQMYWHFHDRSESRAQRALAEATEALRLKPNYGRALLALAEYHFRVRREDGRAMEVLEQAHGRSPSDPDIFNLIQLLAKRLGRWDDALKASRKLTALRPTNASDFYFLALNLDLMRRYPEAVTAIDRAIYLAPERREFALERAVMQFHWSGDLTRLGQWAGTQPELPPLPPPGTPAPRTGPSLPGDDSFLLRFQYYRWTRQAEMMLRMVVTRPDDFVFRDKTLVLPKSLLVAQAVQMLGPESDYRAALERGAEVLREVAEREPEEARLSASRGAVLARLGKKEEAMALGTRAMELMSVAKEPIFGPDIQAAHAEICLLVGERARGLALLRDLLSRPGELSAHELRVDPRWDFARQIPGFPELAAK